MTQKCDNTENPFNSGHAECFLIITIKIIAGLKPGIFLHPPTTMIEVIDGNVHNVQRKLS